MVIQRLALQRRAGGFHDRQAESAGQRKPAANRIAPEILGRVFPGRRPGEQAPQRTHGTALGALAAGARRGRARRALLAAGFQKRVRFPRCTLTRLPGCCSTATPAYPKPTPTPTGWA